MTVWLCLQDDRHLEDDYVDECWVDVIHDLPYNIKQSEKMKIFELFFVKLKGSDFTIHKIPQKIEFIKYKSFIHYCIEKMQPEWLNISLQI